MSTPSDDGVMAASETTRGTADRGTTATATATVGNPGVLIGTEDVGGQRYARYRAAPGTWVSSSLQEQGYAARYGRDTGYGAYTGIVRSPDGTPLDNPDRIRPGQEYLVPVARAAQPAPRRTELSPQTPERFAEAAAPRATGDRYGAAQAPLRSPTAPVAPQFVLPVPGPAVTALARLAPVEGEALVLEELSAEALLAGPKPPPTVWPYLLPVLTWGWAAYQWNRVFKEWQSVERGREEARNLLRQSQQGVRNLWQNDIITDEEYALYLATGTLVVQPNDGPRPGETGAQYERRVFRETPLGPASKTYQGWRGGTSGSLKTWWNAAKGRFGAEEAARAEKMLAMSAGRFVAAYGSKQLQAMWAQRESIRDKVAAELAEARKRMSDTPKTSKEYKQASARVDDLAETLDEINSAESREIGALRPDQVELFLDDKRAVITDITLKLHDPWHELKSLVYRDVVHAITGFDAVAVEFRTAQQQVFLGSAQPQPAPQTPKPAREPESPDAGVAPSR